MHLAESEHVAASLKHCSRSLALQQIHEGDIPQCRSFATHYRRNSLAFEMVNQKVRGCCQIRNDFGTLRRYALIEPFADGLAADAERSRRVRLVEIPDGEYALEGIGIALPVEMLGKCVKPPGTVFLGFNQPFSGGSGIETPYANYQISC